MQVAGALKPTFNTNKMTFLSNSSLTRLTAFLPTLRCFAYTKRQSTDTSSAGKGRQCGGGSLHEPMHVETRIITKPDRHDSLASC